MGKRFAIVIGVAALGVMVLGAQTVAAGVVHYDTKVTINQDRSPPHTLLHGGVKSEVGRCEARRRVVVFKQRTGADRKLGTDRTGGRASSRHTWGIRVPEAKIGWHVYAKVRRKMPADGNVVCRPDRSQTYTII